MLPTKVRDTMKETLIITAQVVVALAATFAVALAFIVFLFYPLAVQQ